MVANIGLSLIYAVDEKEVTVTVQYRVLLPDVADTVHEPTLEPDAGGLTLKVMEVAEPPDATEAEPTLDVLVHVHVAASVQVMVTDAGIPVCSSDRATGEPELVPPFGEKVPPLELLLP